MPFFLALQAKKIPTLTRDKAKVRPKFLQDSDIPIRQLLGPSATTGGILLEKKYLTYNLSLGFVFSHDFLIW